MVVLPSGCRCLRLGFGELFKAVAAGTVQTLGWRKSSRLLQAKKLIKFHYCQSNTRVTVRF